MDFGDKFWLCVLFGVVFMMGMYTGDYIDQSIIAFDCDYAGQEVEDTAKIIKIKCEVV